MSRVMEAPLAAPRPAPLLPGARLLVAEDDDDMRGLLAWSLRRAGYVVLEARNGSELLERVAAGASAATPVDLVIADVHMPGVTGLQALEFLRHSGNAIPVILITAFGDRNVTLQARLLGATAVLDKPFEAEHLEAVLSRLSHPTHGG